MENIENSFTSLLLLLTSARGASVGLCLAAPPHGIVCRATTRMLESQEHAHETRQPFSGDRDRGCNIHTVIEAMKLT
jgi:DNA-binding IscR family transcriptional regulator